VFYYFAKRSQGYAKENATHTKKRQKRDVSLSFPYHFFDKNAIFDRTALTNRTASAKMDTGKAPDP